MLRIFTSVKIQPLRPGLNPRTLVPEASILTTRPQKRTYATFSETPLRCSSTFQLLAFETASQLMRILFFFDEPAYKRLGQTNITTLINDSPENLTILSQTTFNVAYS